mmetsp:Transcript_35373/g.105668  ORF Transcript_35373/g.105668 Transcript_35373/m.105668 type:complete len:326 (-) Transcript_35373:200-1177(-)|eukprot:CAMPEP_0113545884 /NCGR_PEP_ID=MMETSP0015_2-20120614/11506_1 /TAXON_ID=2838 /ORGANISM="Odontella" /LENGTH=325 /DNA_ID=CAMNT_0000446293 /DNA_START=368 /DNA_END=1345 /DNA_ORIENTATION=- /assembly_acc=CAM_ASM_000160
MIFVALSISFSFAFAVVAASDPTQNRQLRSPFPRRELAPEWKNVCEGIISCPNPCGAPPSSDFYRPHCDGDRPELFLQCEPASGRCFERECSEGTFWDDTSAQSGICAHDTQQSRQAPPHPENNLMSPTRHGHPSGDIQSTTPDRYNEISTHPNDDNGPDTAPDNEALSDLNHGWKTALPTLVPSAGPNAYPIATPSGMPTVISSTTVAHVPYTKANYRLDSKKSKGFKATKGSKESKSFKMTKDSNETRDSTRTKDSMKTKISEMTNHSNGSKKFKTTKGHTKGYRSSKRSKTKNLKKSKTKTTNGSKESKRSKTKDIKTSKKS